MASGRRCVLTLTWKTQCWFDWMVVFVGRVVKCECGRSGVDIVEKRRVPKFGIYVEREWGWDDVVGKMGEAGDE